MVHRLTGRLLAVALLLGACGDRNAGAPGPTFAVDTETSVFVDPTRPTSATATSPAAPSRTIATDLYWPRASGPFPLVVLSHGLKSHPSRFSRLLRALAQDGYVAAAPAYPLTNSSAPQGGDHAEDVFNQPRDLSFVIDEILRRSASADSPLSGRVDPDRIGLIGSSLGAITSLGAAYNSCCRDDRIGAVISISGLLFPFPGAFDLRGPALLLIHGDADDTIPYSSSVSAYDAAAPPKFLLTLVGGGHDVAQLGIDTQGAQTNFDVFAPILSDFLDVYLRDDTAALGRLVHEAQIAGLTKLEFQTE